MQTQKKSYQKISTAILIFLGIYLYGSDNMIINKTIIAPNSIVTGNTGIIINGKKYEQGSQKKQKVAYTTLSLPSDLKKIVIYLSESKVRIKKGDNSITFDKRLTLSIKDGIVALQSKGEKYEPTITIKTDTPLPPLVIEGDTLLHIKNSITSLKIEGDATLFIQKPQEHIHLQIDGDCSIYASAPIEKLSIQFQGDVVLNLDKIDIIELEGEGDVILNSAQKDIKIVKNFRGDFIQGSEND